MVQFSNGIWNPGAWPFDIPTNGHHSVKNHLNSRQKRPDFKWFVFGMVGTKATAIAKARLFENQTIWNLTFIKSGLHMVVFRFPLYITFPTLKWLLQCLTDFIWLIFYAVDSDVITFMLWRFNVLFAATSFITFVLERNDTVVSGWNAHSF